MSVKVEGEKVEDVGNTLCIHIFKEGGECEEQKNNGWCCDVLRHAGKLIENSSHNSISEKFIIYVVFGYEENKYCFLLRLYFQINGNRCVIFFLIKFCYWDVNEGVMVIVLFLFYLDLCLVQDE